MIGEDVTVGENTVIERSVIGEGCRIGAGVRIVDSYLWAGAEVEDGASLVGAILASRAMAKTPAGEVAMEPDATRAWLSPVVLPCSVRVSLYLPRGGRSVDGFILSCRSPEWPR